MRRRSPRPAIDALRAAAAQAAPRTTLATVQTAWEEAVGGEQGRSVRFHLSDGHVEIRAVGRDVEVI